MTRRLLFVVNVDWFFLSHRMPIALAAMRSGYEVHIATGFTDRRHDLERAGLVVHPLTLERGSSGIVEAALTLVELVRIYRSVRPNLVHLVTIKPILLGGIAARLTGMPAVVASVSGLGFVFMAKGTRAKIRLWLVERVYRLALGCRNLVVIFQNSDDRDTLIRLCRLSPGQMTTIRGSGVDLSEFSYSNPPVGIPIVILAARMLVDKGVREFVLAARELCCRGLRARFCLVGGIDPANRASLSTDEMDDIAREGHLELWGHRTDMPQVLASASLVVLPSYREGLPKILIEAAACGRAVVTTDVPGCRDAIHPGSTGLLVPPRQHMALADAMENLLLDPQRRLEMGQAARALAEQDYDLRQVVDRHLRIYEHLLGAA